MTNWKQSLIARLPTEARLVIVNDPESLFLEALPLAEELGYHVYQHSSLFALTRFFEDWKRTKYKAIIHVGPDTRASVPFNVRQAATELPITWELLFTNVHREALRVLERDYLPVLLSKPMPARPLTVEQSIHHVLEAVFSCRPKDINSMPEFMAYLVRLHYRGLRMPALYAEAVASVIDDPELLPLAPLEPLLTSSNTLMTLLQEEWQQYIDALAQGKKGGRIPFSHKDVRVYIDNLFQEGFLEPVEWVVKENIPLWVKPGLKMPREEDDSHLLLGLTDKIHDSLPESDATFSDWNNFMRLYAETLHQFYAHRREPEISQKVNLVRSSIKARFKEWVLSSYSSQQTRAVSTQPYMVNHIPLFMKRQVAERNAKIALVVLDCMGWDAWVMIRDHLNSVMRSLEMTETSVLAQVPSITSISRQAIFAGAPPRNFVKNIATSSEAKLWRTFWEHHAPHIRSSYCGVLKGAKAVELDDIAPELNNEVLGLVVGMIDETVHGSPIGIAAVQSVLKVWLETGWLQRLLNLVLDNNYEILLTSDHGYTEAIGQGSPSQGALVTKRGERVRIYDNETFCQQAKHQFPDSIVWKNGGMPEGYYSLIADDDKAFITYNELAVVHGGISPEELLVPFVHIRRRQHE